MALRLKTEEVPQNAVVLTKSEALKYQWQQIANWKPQSNVWSFNFGSFILGGVAAISGAYINYRFRKVMKMRDFGQIASTTNVVVCPLVLTTCLQSQYVASEILLPIDKCAICLELRTIFIQNVCAIGYPFLLVPISNFMLAIRGQTHRIPYYKNYKELFRFCGLLYKPIIPQFILLSIINVIAANFILYKQYQCMSYMQVVNSMNEQIPISEQMMDAF